MFKCSPHVFLTFNIVNVSFQEIYVPDILLTDTHSSKKSHIPLAEVMPTGAGEPHGYGATEGVSFQTYISGPEGTSRSETQGLGPGSPPADSQQLDKHYQTEGNLISP